MKISKKHFKKIVESFLTEAKDPKYICPNCGHHNDTLEDDEACVKCNHPFGVKAPNGNDWGTAPSKEVKGFE